MLKVHDREDPGMDAEIVRFCPECGTERTFYQCARTTLHLGPKVKYRCSECSYGFVRIDEVVDTGATAD
ncbi:hypothetical protein BRD00_11485 [Halobacteriales archaeon QS_8_69_26]|nr:MAG: hypothetical protein BRD00_11485 [Halobacteriales archaeon QS_8_69_26]